MDRGKAICQELTRAGYRHMAWLCDSETHFMNEAILHDSSLKVIKVCHEGEAAGICAGLYLGGARGSLMISNLGLIQCGNILKYAIESEIPLIMLVGYTLVSSSQGATRRRVKKDYAEPFLDAFGVRHYTVDNDSDVAMVGLACKEAEELRRPVAVLLTSADSYEPGT